MSLASKLSSFALLGACAVVGFEMGWTGTGRASDRTAESTVHVSPSGSTDLHTGSLSALGPSLVSTSEAANLAGPKPDLPARVWIGEASASFARDGAPGSLEGPWRLDRAEELDAPSNSTPGARLWIEQEWRLWAGTPADSGGSWQIRSVAVLGWYRLSARSRRDGTAITSSAVLGDGTPLPRVAGSIPLVDDEVLAAARGFVPAPLRPEAARGDTIRVRLDPAAQLRGRLHPAPRAGGRLWLELAGGAGAMECELSEGGSFEAFLVPEGFHMLKLDARDRVLGYYGGIGAPVRAPVTDLGVVSVVRSGTLELEVEPATEGPLWLCAWDPGQRPELAELASRRVFRGARVAANTWRFEGIRTPFAGGFVWSESGGRGELSARALGTEGAPEVSRVRLSSHRSLDLRLVMPGGCDWRRWRLLATPSWLGRADPLWRMRKKRRPWIPVREAPVAENGSVRLSGLTAGDWWVAALRPNGRAAAKRSFTVSAGVGSIEGGAWFLRPFGTLRVHAPRCGKHRGTHRIRVALGPGLRPTRLRVKSNASPVSIQDLPAGEREVVQRFIPKLRGPGSGLDLAHVGEVSSRERTILVRIVSGAATPLRLSCLACAHAKKRGGQAHRSGSALQGRADSLNQPERSERRR